MFIDYADADTLFPYRFELIELCKGFPYASLPRTVGGNDDGQDGRFVILPGRFLLQD
jgi:hypothetical protein